MTQIDKTNPVLVTGATGYIAGHIVKRLLDDGLTVHAAVRDPANAEKLKHLNGLAEETSGIIHYFKSDLLDVGSYADAMQDCELVFHTASPCILTVANPEKDLIEPARSGTRNVLEQAKQTKSVKRVVVTSSCGAVHGDNRDLQDSESDLFTEDDWNTTSSATHQAYSYSKTLAERDAWRIAESQDRWDLIAINPTVVVGAGIKVHADAESFALIRRFGDGTMKAGVPDYGIGLVDARDVAEAHMKAAFTPSASGRYIVLASNTSFPEIARVLRDRFGDAWRFPKKTVPRWLVWLFGPLVDKTLSRKMVVRNVGYPFLADNSKSIRELGMNYRPIEESLTELFQQMIDAGLISKGL